ncbi:SPARC-like [Centruroides vittatus]|uniref:SPARC-like n=1 Tax=Centruroides vittatus TaxID=120091 RepID=UPI00351077E4
MRLLFIFLLVCLVIALSVAKKHHHKNHHEKKHFRKTEIEKDMLDLIAEDDAEEERKKKKLKQFEKLDDIILNGGYDEDPCRRHHCGAGKHCEIDADGKPECVCVKACPRELDERRRVCSNHNETWDSDCHLHRMRCLCMENDALCRHRKYKHVHINYYGGCKEITPCRKEELEDFPRRMREWLFNVMQDLARRAELKEPYIQLENEAEKASSRKWVNAVIWKFCDLDVHPHDRVVSRHELFPIKATLLSMEHCIAPFLDNCDANNDHRITLLEWGQCLGLDSDEIEDKCSMIRKKHG